MKRILYLSYDGMTDPLGQSQVLPYLCGLSKKDYQFTLVSCEKPARFTEHKSVIEQITRANNIEWHPLPYTKKPPILSTVKDLRRMRRLCVRLHKQKPFDMVHCRGHVPAITGLYLKRKYGLKFFFDMRGFWADEKTDAGAWPLSNPVYKAVYTYFKKKEKAFIEEADGMVCLTHKAFDEMRTWKHVRLKEDRVAVIPCCVDTELFSSKKLDGEKRKNLQKELGIEKEHLVISYLGSIGTWYMLDEMLDFFKILKSKVPEARFLFITQDEHERIKNTAVQKGLSLSDIIIRPAKRAEVPLLLSLSDYSVFFIRPTYSKISSSPTKQGEIMAMGIPVVCNAGVGDTDRIVEKYASGKLLAGMDVESYRNSIEALLQEEFNAENIRKGALDFFSLEKGVEHYARMYQKILEPQKTTQQLEQALL